MIAERKQIYVWWQGLEYSSVSVIVFFINVSMVVAYVLYCLFGSVVILEHKLASPLRVPVFLTVGGLLPPSIDTIPIGYIVHPLVCALLLFVIYLYYYYGVAPILVNAQLLAAPDEYAHVDVGDGG